MCLTQFLSYDQDNGFLGVSHGLYIGASGLFLKPTSGVLDMLSKALCGAGGKIKAWGDEASRGPPKTRVRNPRQFSGLASDVSGMSSFCAEAFIDCDPGSLCKGSH